MAKRKLLVIEDDKAIRRGLASALKFAGYDVIEIDDGCAGKDVAVTCDCDLVLLDLVLPGCDGIEVLQAIRESRPSLPVIIMTARSEESQRVLGLSLGADDYVPKPFGMGELLARVQAVLRRVPERPTDLTSMKISGGKADLARQEVRFDDGTRAELSQRECEVLRYLACNSGRAISRQELLQRVWRLDPTGLDTRTVDMTVTRLREKLRDDGNDPAVLLTVRGKGYMLSVRGEDKPADHPSAARRNR